VNYWDALVFASGWLIGQLVFSGYEAHVRPRKRMIKFAFLAAVFFAVHQLVGRQWFYGLLIAMAAGIALLHGYWFQHRHGIHWRTAEPRERYLRLIGKPKASAMTLFDIEQLVAAEVRGIGDRARQAKLGHLLVEPSPHERSSQHVDGMFTCWVVARAGASVLVYCRGPFGDPWGCLDADATDLGLDSQWFAKLDDAFILRMWDGPLPPDYVVE
jgi:hypothetical protein